VPEPTHKQAQRLLKEMAAALRHIVVCHEQYCNTYGPGVSENASCLKDARTRLAEYESFLELIRK
jgi:hypothetical protein